MGKKKQNSGSSSDSSNNSTNSDSDSSSVKQKKVKSNDSKKERSSSYSDDSELEIQNKKEIKKPKLIKDTETDKGKKQKFDDIQKSKWDSPAENASRNNEKRLDRDVNRRRHTDRDDSRDREPRKYNRQRDDRRDDYRNKNIRNNDERRFREDRRDRGRYDRKNDDRFRSDQRRRSRSRSRSREDNRKDNRRNDFRNRRNQRQNNQDDHENYEWGKKKNTGEKKPAGDKEKPNFGLSGKLTEETNTYRGVVIKYSEPSEARKPKRRWRLYPFKGEKALPTLYIHRESAYLMGRDRKVVDFPLDHPSCSKQHAVLQYRLVPFTRDNGTVGKRIRPYIIDLDSANGTFINNKKIEPRKYVELLEKDVIKFGYSTREYVLLHENSKDETQDDDVFDVKIEAELPIKEEPLDQDF